jgi:hypothetical protein
VGMPVIDSKARLRAGSQVTLVVPREQRRWMRLLYESPFRRGEYAITLRACRRLKTLRAQRRECRWGPFGACRRHHTEFDGGVAVDFANAPRRGLCGELIVWVKGKKRPLRERLFRPDPRACVDVAG